jgi:hypothetical protein
MQIGGKKQFFVLFLIVLFVFIGCNKEENTNQVIDANINVEETELAEITFEPLGTDEILTHKINIDNEGVETFQMSLKMFASGTEDRELFTLTGWHFSEDEQQYSKNLQRVTFIYSKKTSDSISELWFVDGKKGVAKRLFSSRLACIFRMDDNGKTLCVYDGNESTRLNTPVLYVYETETMREIKKIVYEPYRNQPMYPVEMSFKDNAFTVKLSADTVDFATLKIPVDGSEEYRVIESYSWQAERER